MELTARQRELLDYIQEIASRESRMPSYREMAKALGVSAVGTVQDHVQALVEMGYLEKEMHGGRSILKIAEVRRAAAVGVPIVGEVAAGALQDAYEVSLGTLPLSPEFLSSSLKSKGASVGESLFALRVKGESMVDAGIYPRDFVVVQKNAQVRNGDIVVASVRGEATVKEIEMPRRSGEPLRLIPHNKRMSPIEVTLDEEVQVLGKVVAVHRYLS
jgi:repressor LexA